MSKKIKTFSIAMTLLAAASTAFANDHQAPLNGDWMIDEGQGVLEIRGTKWRHPQHGAASIKRGKGASDIEVFYHKSEGMRCAYRTRFADNNNILFLELAEGLQSMEYCPNGKLTRVGR